MFKAISKEQIENHNKKNINNLKKDYEFFLKKTKGLGININNIKKELRNFSIALPSWGLGTGGTRFGKFPIVFIKSYKPEIIVIKQSEKKFYICGLASKEVLNKYQSMSLVLSPLLRKRGTKTGFYGFHKLLPPSTILELIN